MPWGKYRGVRIRLLPDSYLSWLTTSVVMNDPRWWWLRESLVAELKFRGLNYEMAAIPDPEPPLSSAEPVNKIRRRIGAPL